LPSLNFFFFPILIAVFLYLTVSFPGFFAGTVAVSPNSSPPPRLARLRFSPFLPTLAAHPFFAILDLTFFHFLPGIKFFI